MSLLNVAPFLDTTQESFSLDGKIVVKFNQNLYADFQNKKIVGRLAALEEEMTKGSILTAVEPSLISENENYYSATFNQPEGLEPGTYKVQIAYATSGEKTWSSAVRINRLEGMPSLVWNIDNKNWIVSNEAIKRYRYVPNGSWKNGLIPIDGTIPLDNRIPRIKNSKIQIEAETVSGFKVLGETSVFTEDSQPSALSIDISSYPDKVILKNENKSIFFRSIDKENWEYIGDSPKVVVSYLENATEYYYAYQNDNSGLKCLAIINADEPTAKDYEYSYLCDKENTLCLKYDGAVSSFKRNYQDSKQDTLGGEFPYIFRNGNTRYAEMTFTALIAKDLGALSNADFLEEKKSQYRTATNNNSFKSLTPAQVFRQEKAYRDEVYNWLNNGKPKIFKSATEGLFLVYVINATLSPKKELGNMLYEVSATLYEIGDINTDNLLEYNLL